tara:strand:+ start:75 stop:371 length:297 start_codon:yes stop_codon:yes gene_type:complete
MIACDRSTLVGGICMNGTLCSTGSTQRVYDVVSRCRLMTTCPLDCHQVHHELKGITAIMPEGCRGGLATGLAFPGRHAISSWVVVAAASWFLAAFAVF